jgi:outer membrane lipoprotein SlyB
MRTILAFTAAAAMLTGALGAPSLALASNCSNTGTAVGAVAGGLLGNGVSRGGGRTGGTILGALGGAVAGNAIARHNCDQRVRGGECRYREVYSHGRSYRIHECRGRNGYWRRS